MLRIVLAIVFVLSVGILIVGCDYKSPDEIKRNVEISVPIGTSKRDVISFLDKNGFEHSAEYKPKLYYEKNKEISAVAPGKKYGVLTTAKVYIIFRFNEEDRLIEIETREVKTGL
jgi:hypothetical protein